MTARITSDQRKQYYRFVQDAARRALKTASPDKDGLQRLFARGGEFQAHVVEGVRRFTSKAPDYALARTILGPDFLSPEEVATARGVVYTDEQLAKFGETLPAADVLQWCRDNGMMLVAGPPAAMSLLDIRALNVDYFYTKGPAKNNAGWYDDEKQKFSRVDKAEPVWIALRKEAIPGSFSKNWSEQSALVTAPMTVPNAAEAVWCLTTYKAVRNVFLLPSLYVRTSSLDSGGCRVFVGFFNAVGLRVNGYWDDLRFGLLGVAGARKFAN